MVTHVRGGQEASSLRHAAEYDRVAWLAHEVERSRKKCCALPCAAALRSKRPCACQPLGGLARTSEVEKDDRVLPGEESGRDERAAGDTAPERTGAGDRAARRIEAALRITPSLRHSGGSECLARSFGHLGSMLRSVPAFRLSLPDDLDALPGAARHLLDIDAALGRANAMPSTLPRRAPRVGRHAGIDRHARAQRGGEHPTARSPRRPEWRSDCSKTTRSSSWTTVRSIAPPLWSARWRMRTPASGSWPTRTTVATVTRCGPDSSLASSTTSSSPTPTSSSTWRSSSCCCRSSARWTSSWVTGGGVRIPAAAGWRRGAGTE